MVTTTSSASILHPITVDEARNQNYLIGSVGSTDSLFGREELLRYFPNSKIKVFVVSWNMSSKSGPKDIKNLLLPESVTFVPDLYAIGIQEGPDKRQINEFQIQIQATVGASHVLFHSSTLGVLHLLIFIRRDLIWFCTIPEDSFFNTRPSATNLVKTKGAIGISFALFGTSFLFINSHLTAHQTKIKDRIEEYLKICKSLDLPKNLQPLNPRYISNDVTARFDTVFWFGDLNFRLEISTQEIMKIINKPINLSNVSVNYFKESDQLINVIQRGLAFKGFSEPSAPKFPPTYKFKLGSDDYDLFSQRVPSFTDRILYRSKRESHISSLLYDWVPSMVSSDHKPVIALFDVQLKPGRDVINRLNAGNFNRNVYIEAMKIRANEYAIKNGSIVCNIM
ncbi:inositol polyphosphate 5-phosphatase E-like [Oppia nitens]|uniref:inositol polyphosphate 5-phosphatase E-like n=1 Tax=Oppia nitens TaxID=1686743 RepID=UPI0023DBF17E|nr:inositol polyphosphate 5-phosphatase E-like [Oppia nitens]